MAFISCKKFIYCNNVHGVCNGLSSSHIFYFEEHVATLNTRDLNLETIIFTFHLSTDIYFNFNGLYLNYVYETGGMPK